MALRDVRERWIGGVVSIVWAACVYWGAVTVGLVVRCYAAEGADWVGRLDASGEYGLVLAARHLIPGIFSGFVLAAVLAAICSTADSQLVVAASAGANDIYARLARRSRAGSHLLINRAVVFALGAGAVLLVLDEQVAVYKYVLTYGWAVLGAAFGPQLILTLFWRGATRMGCLAGMATGFVVALVWPHAYDAAETGVEVYNLPLAFLLALGVNVGVSLCTGPVQRAR